MGRALPGRSAPFDVRVTRVAVHLSCDRDAEPRAVLGREILAHAPHHVQAVADDDHLVIVAAFVQQDVVDEADARLQLARPRCDQERGNNRRHARAVGAGAGAGAGAGGGEVHDPPICSAGRSGDFSKTQRSLRAPYPVLVSS